MINSVNGQRMSISVENTPSFTPTVILAQKLDAWVSATPAGGGEQRDVAAARIKEAHASHRANLGLAGLGLTSLPDRVFSELKNLTALDLSHNQLISLPDKAFEGLNSLIRLDLSHNQLISLPEKAFEGLSNLINLSLAYNQLTNLPGRVFDGLNNLTNLSLAYNQLTNLPDKVFENLSNLIALFLGYNQLNSLQGKAFEGLSSLMGLFLDGNQFISLPDKAFEGVSNLTRLSLANNKLTSLSGKVFEGLGSLIRLDLDNNQLPILPDRVFDGLSKLTHLPLYNNQLTILPDKTFEGLSSLTALFIEGNQFVFKPVIPGPTRVSIESNLPTLESEFAHGNQALLNFNLYSENIPGTINAQGLFKLELMLQHANQKIVSNDRWAWENSGVLNQLFYQASRLGQDGIQSEFATTQAQTLLSAYLNTNNIKEFAEQAEVMGLAPDQYEAFIFATQNGTEGLTMLKDCYEMRILNAPFANKDAPNSALVNGVLIHKEREDATTLKSPDQLKPFALLNQAYTQTLNKQGLDVLFTLMNMGAEYKQRFTEMLTVQSAGVLARNRGTTEAERAVLLSSYKMVDAQASTRLFDIFSKLVNQSTDPTIDRLVNPAATITEAHFADICRVFRRFQEGDYPALLFVLSTLFVKYSSKSFLGTDNDSPVALRCYAAALLNKLQTLNANIFNSVEGQRLRENLFENSCTDTLSIDMRDLAKNNPTIRSVYEQFMPPMWQ